jgi:hypothetical protein
LRAHATAACIVEAWVEKTSEPCSALACMSIPESIQTLHGMLTMVCATSVSCTCCGNRRHEVADDCLDGGKIVASSGRSACHGGLHGWRHGWTRPVSLARPLPMSQNFHEILRSVIPFLMHLLGLWQGVLSAAWTAPATVHD